VKRCGFKSFVLHQCDSEAVSRHLDRRAGPRFGSAGRHANKLAGRPANELAGRPANKLAGRLVAGEIGRAERRGRPRRLAFEPKNRGYPLPPCLRKYAFQRTYAQAILQVCKLQELRAISAQVCNSKELARDFSLDLSVMNGASHQELSGVESITLVTSNQEKYEEIKISL